MSVFMQPIYTRTVGSGGVSSIVFNNIPQGYTNLKLVMSVRTSHGGAAWDSMTITFNGDTAFNYSATLLFGNGSTAGGNRDVNARAGLAATIATPTNTFGNIDLNIFKYSSGVLKSFESSSTQGNSTTTSLPTLAAGLWNSTAPITSMSISSGTNSTILENSTFTLYGVSSSFAGGIPTAPTIGTVTDQASRASVTFTPAAGDQATSYAVTTTPTSTTTYGSGSPIIAPAPLNTAVTYQVSAVNDRGTSASSSSSSITSANSYASIATIAATSGAVSNFTFNNIPQGYTHLQLRLFYKCVGGNSVEEGYLSFNGAGTNMNAHQLYSTGSSVVASGNTYNSVMFITRIPGGTSLANAFGAGIVDILDYSNNSKYKTAKFIGGYELNGSGQAYISGGVWNEFAPVTSVTFRSNNSFAQYSHAALYGIA